MKTNPQLLGLIPAREGSQGIPGKNMKLLDGKPLIQYTIEAALQSRRLQCIAVSTDSQDISNFCSRFSRVETPFLRPAELANNLSPVVDTILHAIDHYQTAGRSFDYVILLQPTSPFRMTGFIDRAIDQLSELGAESLVSFRKIPDRFNPYWAYEKKPGSFGRLINPPTNTLTVSRRQDLPDTYYRDGEIYITSTSLIREGLVTGGKIAGLITENGFGINLDTMEDWEQAEQIVEEWKRTSSQMC